MPDATTSATTCATTAATTGATPDATTDTTVEDPPDGTTDDQKYEVDAPNTSHELRHPCLDCKSRNAQVHHRKCVQQVVQLQLVDPEAIIYGKVKKVSVQRSDDGKFKCPACDHTNQNSANLLAHMARCPGNQVSRLSFLAGAGSPFSQTAHQSQIANLAAHENRLVHTVVPPLSSQVRNSVFSTVCV